MSGSPATCVVGGNCILGATNSVDDGQVKFGDNPSPEHTIFLAEGITDHVVDTVEIIKSHFEFVFKEELNNGHRLESDWSQNRDLEAFLEWFEI